MKRVSMFRWSVGLVFSLVLAGGVAAESLKFSVKAEGYRVTQDPQGYEIIKMNKFATAAVPASPMLPRRIYNIAVHPDIVWVSLGLTISSADRERLAGTHNIRLCPSDVAWTGSRWLESGTRTEGALDESPVRIVGTSRMRRWNFVKVEFSPFRYSPDSGGLELVRRAEVVLSYTRSGDVSGQASLQEDVLDDAAEGLFLNFGQAREWYQAGVSGDAASALPGYVILTTNAIKNNSAKLDGFVAHKKRMGYTVSVVTESAWGAVAGQAPNHKAEKIRKWLKSNYLTKKIKYVLLIGDPTPYESGEGDVPMKMCWPRLGSGSDEESPTDHFYADLTGNWDKDGDGRYGEWSADTGTGGVDFTPEVYVGRIPVYSGAYATLDGILQKIIDYETDTGNIGWRKSILLPMSFSASGYDGAPLAEQMKDDYLTTAGFTSWRQYQQGTAYASDNSIYASEEELRGSTVVRDRWAAGDYGLVCWWGHGSSTTTAIGYSGHPDGNLFDVSYCSSLDDDHPAFTYQCSCTNAYPEAVNNLAYSILKLGGIGTVSATRVSWFNTGVGYGAFDGSTTNSGIGYEYVRRLAVNESAAGDALYLAKASMTPEGNTRLMNYYDFNLYGDPSVSLTGVLTPPPTITVTSPTASDTWYKKTAVQITWTKSGDQNASVKIQLYKGTTKVKDISLNTPNDGSFDWAVPGTLALGTNYRIRIRTADNAVNAYSDLFAVAKLSIKITAPAAGVTWNRSTTQNITWTAAGPMDDSVMIHLLRGTTVALAIAADTPNSGTFSWTIPASLPAGTDYKIWIRTASKSVSAKSGLFKIK